MASYIAAANANFNTGSTWKLVSANSLLDSESNNVVVATAASWTTSATFVPGAVEVDGVAVKLYARTGTTGTFTIQLYNSTDSTVEGACTVNTADFCSVATPGTTNEGGWVLFTFAAHTLDAADNHVVRCQTSSASQITLYRDATAANISRMVRTTTAAVSPPAAGSILHIMEEKTAAGAATARTVTMDAIAGSITKYGSGTDGTACITISDGGTLNFGYTGATAYYLQLDGDLIVYNSGTLTIGTVANPIPRDGSAILEFDPTADGGMGLIVRNGGTFTAQGLSRTSGKNVVSGKLNVNTVNTETHFHLDTDSGWLSGDTVAIASTSQTYTDCETKILNGAAGAEICNVTVQFGATVHSGTSPTQGDVILITRNVVIRSSSATIMAYVYIQGNTSTVDIDWVEFYYLGEDATGKRGVDISTTTGTFSMQYSSIHDCEDMGVYINSSVRNTTIAYNNLYYCCTVTTPSLYLGTSLNSTVSIDNNILMKNNATSNPSLVNMETLACSFTNNTLTSSRGVGIYIGFATSTLSGSGGTFSGNKIYSNAGYGLDLYRSVNTVTFSNMKVWRNFGGGIKLDSWAGSNITPNYDIVFDTLEIFGNTTSNITFGGGLGTEVNSIKFISVTSNGDTTFSTTNGIIITSGGYRLCYPIFEMISCNFSTVGGIKTAHTNDINFNSAITYIALKCNNCIFASSNEFLNFPTNVIPQSFIKSTKHDQTTGAALIHKSWFKYGIVESDLTYFNTAVPSMRLTPNSATAYTLESGSFKVNVNSGQTVTPHVYVRKSTVASGGALYNGSQPRLVLKRNDGIGVTADAVIETMHVEGATANWEELTGAMASPATENGVAEFVVQCDGTAGFVNVDDFSATVA